MSVNERIRQVRKVNSLTLEKFGSRISITKGALSQIENGRANPSDQTIMLICREYNVSKTWLRTGEGPIESPPPDDTLGKLALEYGLTARDRVMIEKFLMFDEDEREVMIRYVEKVAAELAALSAMTVERKETPEERHERHKREARAEADELYEVILQEKMEQDNPDTTFGSSSFGSA